MKIAVDNAGDTSKSLAAPSSDTQSLIARLPPSCREPLFASSFFTAVESKTYEEGQVDSPRSASAEASGESSIGEAERLNTSPTVPDGVISGNEQGMAAKCSGGSSAMLATLLAFGADASLCDSNGNTALHYAAARADVSAIRMLKAHAHTCTGVLRPSILGLGAPVSECC